jgi:hypothetical protein
MQYNTLITKFLVVMTKEIENITKVMNQKDLRRKFSRTLLEEVIRRIARKSMR